jgi:hypothetical protein
MATFIRKSVKFGPCRVNLSKSGVGTSFGVKGLRVGVNSKGKTYAAGGRHGLYFRESLDSSGKSNGVKSNTSMPYATSEQKSGNGFLYVLYAAILILSFIYPILFVASIPCTLIIIGKIVAKQKLKKFKNTFLITLDELLAKKDVNGINEIISQIPENIKNEVERITFILNIYSKIACSFLEDNIIDDDEKKVLENIISIVSPSVLQQINIVLVNEILKNAVSDKRISNEEEELINKCINLFQLYDIKNEINQTINDYKQLEIIESSELPIIKPSNNINDDSPFHYENDCQFKKSRTQKGEQYIEDDSVGKLLVSSKNIHFVSNGHKTTKISSIISIDIVDKNIEMIVNNRKTPYYFSVNNPISLLGIMKKLMK